MFLIRLLDGHMSNFKVFKEKVLEKFEGIRNSFKKLTQNLSDFTGKISRLRQTVDQKFSDFFSKLQSENPVIAEVKEDLQTKQLIQGEMTFQDIDQLTKTLWENHDQAQEAFQETNDLQYHEMAMDILVVIREMEQLKEYLGKHGKI